MEEFISRLRKDKIFISMEDGELKVNFNGSAIAPEILSELKANKLALIKYLTKNRNTSEFQSIKVIPQNACYELSSSQKRLWILSQFEDGSAAYNLPVTVELSGNYNIENFRKSIYSIIERHEILRTVFKEDESGEVKQWVLSPQELNFELKYEDIRGLPNNEELAKQYIDNDSIKAFDLSNGPVFRSCLLQLKDDYFLFYYNMHHIISDGWSKQILERDVRLYYTAYNEGNDPKLPQLRIQYKDYAAWQIEKLSDERYTEHREFWKKCLFGDLPVIDFPSSRERPKFQTFNGGKLITHISTNLTEKLKTYCQYNGGSLFMGLFATWSALCYRYTGQQDLIFGTPVAGRDHADLEDQIGFYINTLALRVDLDPKDTLDDLFGKVKNITLLAYSHQIYSFDSLIEDLNLIRDTSRNPVFDVMITMQNLRDGSKGRIVDESLLDQFQFEQGILSMFDLDVNFEEVQNCIAFEITYNTNLYDKEMIEGLMVHFKSLLDLLLSNPLAEIGKVKYLSPAEENQLLTDFNNTVKEFPKDKTIVDYFEDQVIRTPDNVAIVSGDKELSYKLLNEVSNQLSNFLKINCRLAPNDIIGIKLDRSEQLIVAILAVLKLRAVYVPIDPEYPDDRIDFIIEDSKCKLVIDNELISEFQMSQSAYSKENLATSNSGQGLAYIIYTSGTTGVPKGVMIENQSVMEYALTFNEEFGITENDKVIQQSSISFDTHVEEIYPALICGATLLISENGGRDSYELEDLINRKGATILSSTPMVLEELNNRAVQPNKLRLIVSGGDKFRTTFVSNFYDTITIYDTYGPSESTVCTTFSKINTTKNTGIGKPIANRQIYIVDTNEQLVPIGVKGEIWIGGNGLARGYLNNPELTNLKFVANPFIEGQRVYKSGDQGKWLPDGSIEFIGRLDDQIKVRGYRIELGEIEHALLKVPGICLGVVVVKEGDNSEKELVAYFTSDEEQTVTALRGALKSMLPDYMLPGYFVQLESLPLTSNGKVNKLLLPSPAGLGLRSGVAYVAPQGDIEIKMVSIWEELLEKEKIGVEDDFFALGGHSLKASRLLTSYSKYFDVRLTLKDVFSHTTIRSQANLVKGASKVFYKQIQRVDESESYPLSDAQRRLWVLSQFEGESAVYNMPGFVRLESSINVTCFRDAFDLVIERHEILRTVFKETSLGEVYQWVLPLADIGFRVSVEDFSPLADSERRVSDYIALDSYRPFDLEKGPLMRASLLKISEDVWVFYYNLHHIICDGWSMDVLSGEVVKLYEQLNTGLSPVLDPLPIQYKDYSHWQLESLQNGSLSASRNYWLDRLSGDLSQLNLPTVKKRPLIKTHQGHRLGRILSLDLSSSLREYTLSRGGSLFMSLLSSWSVLFYRYTNQADIIIGSPVAGRDHSDLSSQIGFYVNTLVFRNTIDPKDSYDSLYRSVKETTLMGLSHQMYPFDRLVEDLGLHRDISRSAVFDVMLTLQNTSDSQHAIAVDQVGVITDYGVALSKFDLDITFVEQGDYISYSLLFNTDVYERSMIEGLMLHYELLLKSLLSTPDLTIGLVDFLTASDKQQYSSFNATSTNYPQDKTLVDLFREQVLRTPDAMAVVFGDRSLTYVELDRSSSALAHYLVESYDIELEDLVGIKLDRSEWMIIAIIGVLKAGGAYVPIDPDYPSDRIAYIEKDTSCKVCIDEQELDRFRGRVYSEKALTTEITADNLAYVIYTSGSTGQPKGVMVEHRSILNTLYGQHSIFRGRRALLFASISFDAFISEAFNCILFGDQLFIAPDDCRRDTSMLETFILENKIEVLTLPPAIVREMDVAKLTTVKALITAGEAPDYQKAIAFSEFGEYYNAYGPTEASVCASMYKLNKEEVRDGQIPIGRPLGNTEVYVLSAADRLQPIGVPGEICLGGSGLARGYLNQEALTREKFIAHPFREGERLYRTGDLGYWNADGTISFVGRKDDQVKIRGYRIELGEIEHALLKVPGISSGVVVVKEGENSEKELIAYFTSQKEQTIMTLREAIMSMLPHYMVPSAFVRLEKLPLTPNGKLDKNALPSPNELSRNVDFMPPSDEIEEKLVKIWTEILERKDIGVLDNFFLLGGHSLKAIQLISRVRKEFDVKLNYRELFMDATIRGLKEEIEKVYWANEQQSAIDDDEVEHFSI
jgi:amino acid adenylation domain-containing protein